MSLPSFPGSNPTPTPSPSSPEPTMGAGAGDHLPVPLLAMCGACTAAATALSVMSIYLQLKNYRKPALQRAVVRIMVMVPLYALSSLISLFSLNAAFFIDAVRDLYEAFVIYTFLQLLITYLGGERSLLITLHGRQPIAHPFPVNLVFRPLDPSDPWTLLNLKRGVLQYVQVKPLLVLATVILKATNTYHEGEFAANSGYTYVTIVYNISICLSLYCLAMFWVAVNKDLKPFRPVPKFLCVKGILFFSFWQSVGISLLVAVGAIRKVGPYTDAEHMSLALVDSLICFEMPFFALAHQYAFQASDYIDLSLIHAARLPFIYALRDAFGFKDVWEDTKDTFKGRGVSYQAYEPAEGGLHYGLGRQRRIRAGLRYAKGGKAKYWIPTPGEDAGPISSIQRRIEERRAAREGYAPLLPKQAANVVHYDESDSDDSDAPSLEFLSADEDEESLYERARRIGYAGFPNVDVSREQERRRRWEVEEGILSGRRTRASTGTNGSAVPASGSGSTTPAMGERRSSKGKGRMGVYGAWAEQVSSVAPPRLEVVDAAAFDGENENPGAWRQEGGHDGKRSGSRIGGDVATSLKWTRKRSTPESPFALGDDDESVANSNGNAKGNGTASLQDLAVPTTEIVRSPHSPLSPRPDAIDLVIEDEEAVERARTRERLKGEPQTNVPAKVYRALGQAAAERIFPDDQGEGGGQEPEDITPPSVVNEALGKVTEQLEVHDVTTYAITPPLHARFDSPDEHNPWA